MVKNFKTYIGNNFGFTFEITSLESIDNAAFAVRETIMDAEPVIFKTIEDMTKIADNKYRVTVSADETDELMPLNYIYGLQISYGSNVKTVLEGKILVDIDPARS